MKVMFSDPFEGSSRGLPFYGRSRRQGVMVKGFIRQQQERMAVRFLAWQYQRMNQPVPGVSSLEKQAAKLVEDAHTIAKRRGRNVVAIIKELAEDIRKEKE